PRARVPGPGLDPGRPAVMIRLRIVRAVVEKELRETLRDRRTLIVMILLPLTLYPLLTLIFASIAVAQRQKETDRPSTVCLDGGSRALSDALGAEQKVTVTGRGGCSVEDIRRRSLHAIVEIPAGFERALVTAEPRTARILYDDSDDASHLAADRVRTA